MGYKILSDEDRGFEAFFENLRIAQKARVKVGIQGDDAAKVAGMQQAGRGGAFTGGITMASLGEVHEFGATITNGFGMGILIVIPQRSFIRSTADLNKPKYNARLWRISKAMIRRPGAVNVRGELFKLGQKVRKDIINRIRKAEIKQDLAPMTKKRKAKKAGGKVEPALIDEGLLINSISAIVTGN